MLELSLSLKPLLCLSGYVTRSQIALISLVSNLDAEKAASLDL